MKPRALRAYAAICGWTLARAHARTGDRAAIAGYLGSGTRFDEAIADFAETHADQNERDHAALAAAESTGRINVATTRPTSELKPKPAGGATLEAPGVGIEPTTSRLTVERICLIELPRTDMCALPRRS
jgi:hypothetical protein